MLQKNSLILVIIIISLLLGFVIGRYVLPKTERIEVIDYGEEYYTTQIQENLSTIDSLESIIKAQESIVDSFLNKREQIRVEYVIKREEIKSLPLDSSVLLLRNFIKEYEKNPINVDNLFPRDK
jgi:hypothetical protein